MHDHVVLHFVIERSSCHRDSVTIFLFWIQKSELELEADLTDLFSAGKMRDV